MNNTEVLIINGSPGSGKSTLANAIAEKLREMNFAHAVIDVDELARTYPELPSSFRWKNLSLVWPNYLILTKLKGYITCSHRYQRRFTGLTRSYYSLRQVYDL